MKNIIMPFLLTKKKKEEMLGGHELTHHKPPQLEGVAF
jgi:hypothetical protein